MEYLSFEQKLKNLIESRMLSVSTLDEVYLKAEERQNKLFEIIFQECYYYAIFNYISLITLANTEQKILQLQAIGVIKKEVNIEQFAWLKVTGKKHILGLFINIIRKIQKEK